MADILLTAHGTLGDVAPMARIGGVLRAHGHHVTLITHCYYAGLAEQIGLEFVALDSQKEYAQYIEDLPIMYAPNRQLIFHRKHTLPLAMREYEVITQRHRGRDTVLIASHLFITGSQAAAEKTGISLARVFTSVTHVTGMPLLEDLCKEVFAQEINDFRAKVGLSPVSNWHAWLRYPRQSIGAWPNWFAPPESGWPAGLNLTPVGFLMSDEAETGQVPEDLQEFLDSGEPPILITGGTGVYTSDFYSVSIEACRLLGRRGIVVTPHQRLLPRQLPDQIKWFKFLPFASVMPHMAAVIHHGGTSTLIRALSVGIPQLSLPVGTDRPDSAIRFQRLGVAECLPLPQWQPELIVDSLRRLLYSSTVQECCQAMARRMREENPAAAICEVVERLIPKAGFSETLTQLTRTDHEDTTAQTRDEDSQKDALLERLARLSPEKRALLVSRMQKGGTKDLASES